MLQFHRREIVRFIFIENAGDNRHEGVTKITMLNEPSLINGVLFRAGSNAHFIDGALVGTVRYRSCNRGLTPTADAVDPAGLA
jgi:hypothetical protein